MERFYTYECHDRKNFWVIDGGFYLGLSIGHAGTSGPYPSKAAATEAARLLNITAERARCA